MTDMAIVPAANRDVARFDQLDEAAIEYVHAGVAPNTRRAFEGAIRGFASWCASADLPFSPADVRTVERYITARAPKLAASTLALHLCALNDAARVIETPEPGRHPRIKALMRGIRRRHGRPPVKKRGLLADDVKGIVRATPGSLTGLRDRTVVLVCFAAVLRRSELAALSLDPGDVRAVFVAEGLEIHIARAKGDQEGKGAIVAVPFGREVCPVAALREWIAAAGIASGPIFRPINRHGHVLPRQLTDRSVARIVKAGAERIGIDPATVSGHSPRRGGITQMRRLGATPEELQRHARHADFKTTLGYIEEADRFASSAARNSGL